MTVYCDNDNCSNYDDGFCWADSISLDDNGIRCLCHEVIKENREEE